MSNHLLDPLFAAANPESVFLTLPGGESQTYGDILARSGQMANVLIELGVVPGDRVAAQVGKSSDALALYLASLRAGAVFLPLNTAYTSGELDYFLGDAEPRVFACDAAAGVNVPAGVSCAVIALHGAASDDCLSTRADRADASFETVARSADDLGAILYTSGTTGRPKGAMLSHGNLLSNALALRDLWQFTRADVLLHALPIFHTHGLFVATNTSMLAGGAMQFLPRFELDQVLACLPDATAMMGVPTFYTRLLDDARFTREAAAHMRVFISGSAPMLEETHRAFEERTGQRILERYGMTETNMNTSNPYDGERRPGTVGFPLPGVEVRVTDPDTGSELPTASVGMIEVRGDNVFKGYWRKPDKTAEDFRDDGFFITGDLGQIDTDGYVHIVGRGKDLIISGGFNVYPKEVELVIDAVPGVLESAVYGVPHPDFGEGVVATVVAEDATLEEASILAAVVDQLAKFKQPKKILFASELPRNAMGKVQKNLLRDASASLFT